MYVSHYKYGILNIMVLLTAWSQGRHPPAFLSREPFSSQVESRRIVHTHAALPFFSSFSIRFITLALLFFLLNIHSNNRISDPGSHIVAGFPPPSLPPSPLRFLPWKAFFTARRIRPFLPSSTRLGLIAPTALHIPHATTVGALSS